MNFHGCELFTPYNKGVRTIRIALSATAALMAAVFAIAPACAQTSTNITMPLESAPVIRMQMHSGTVTIRTWDRMQVQIESTDPVRARRFGSNAVERAMAGGDIPIFSMPVMTPYGPIILPPEEFSISTLPDGPHDGVVIFGGASAGSVTVTVPNSTAFMWVMIGHGDVRMQDYRNGTFVARVHMGTLTLENVSGDAYVEVAHGTISARDSAFNRIRARTAIGNIIFANCNARQIVVSSVYGSIAYDNGTFVPGLARFETENGSIAMGIAGGGAEIGAHAFGGQIYSNFKRADVRGAGTQMQAVVNGGGPVITASSSRGNVYLYQGSFTSLPALPPQWRAASKIFKAKTSAKPPYRV